MWNFSIPFEGSAAVIISKASQGIRKVGGSFNEESPTKGNFHISSPFGKIQGGYTIQGQAIEISITQKPAFIGINRIEKELRERLNGSN